MGATGGTIGYKRQGRTSPRRREGQAGELGSGSDSPRPVTLPKPAPAAVEPEPEELPAKRARLERVGAWLLEHEPDHSEWSRGAAAYVALAEEIRALERGPLHELSQPGDDYVGPPVEFPADYAGPLVAGKWERLPDGRFLATGLTLFDLRVMALFQKLAQEAAELVALERA